jgi:hypothetical protein
MGAANRILRAIVALPTFTVAELVAVCDVPAATARTVLHRNPSWFEAFGEADTGKRGGRWKEYRATPEAHRAALQLDRQPAADGAAIPDGLRGAEELLLPATVGMLARSTSESLLRRAMRFRNDASSEMPPTPAVRAHSLAVDILIALTAAEVDGDRVAWQRVREQLDGSRELLRDAGQELLDPLDRRIEGSPLGLPLERELVTDAFTSPSPLATKLVEVILLVSDLARSAWPSPHTGVAYGYRSRPTGSAVAAGARARLAHQRTDELFGTVSEPFEVERSQGHAETAFHMTQSGYGFERSLPENVRYRPVGMMGSANSNQLSGWRSEMRSPEASCYMPWT